MTLPALREHPPCTSTSRKQTSWHLPTSTFPVGVGVGVGISLPTLSFWILPQNFTTESSWWLPWKTLPQKHLQSVKKWLPECLAKEAEDSLEGKWSSVCQALEPRLPESPLKGAHLRHCLFPGEGTQYPFRETFYLLCLCGPLHQRLPGSWQVTKPCEHLFLLSFWSPQSSQHRRKGNGRVVCATETCDGRNSNEPASLLRPHSYSSRN